MKAEFEYNITLSDSGKNIYCSFSNAMKLYEGNSLYVKQKKLSQEYTEFLELKEKWKEETLYESSSDKIFSNSNYVRIIAFGTEALPWIIKDLKRNGGFWFAALKKITGINPIKNENIGKYEGMKQDWLEWSEKYYLDEKPIINS